MKKYLRLICSSCKRTVDRLVDNQRVQIDRCVITLNCPGRLQPAVYLSNSDIAPSPQVGITDWYPRGRKVSSFTQEEVELINTATGAQQQWTLAVKMLAAPPPNSKARLLLQTESAVPKAFRQYTFIFDTSFSSVSGIETGVEKKLLRFTAFGPNPDVVEVFVNGQRKIEGNGANEFAIYRGGPFTVPPDTVVFNTPISASGEIRVDVIVSKQAPQTVFSIDFQRHQDGSVNSGAWENIDSVSRFDGTSWETFYLFSFEVLGNTQLPINSLIRPISLNVIDDAFFNVSIPLDDVHVKLARKPFTHLDRYSDLVVILSSITGPEFFKFSTIDGIPTLQVTKSAVKALFPPGKLTKFDTENTIQTIIPGVDEQLVIDGQVIVGPDA